MAVRRDKNQARRNQGNNGLPGWAWGVMGLLLGIGLILAAPRLLKSDGDGFFRPQPNPDAQPAPVVAGDEEVVAEKDEDAPPRARASSDADQGADYDFYTLLPGKEVALSDAELAATERAEAQRATQQQKLALEAAAQAGGKEPATAAPPGTTLPTPVNAGGATAATPTASAAGPAIETTAKPPSPVVPATSTTAAAAAPHSRRSSRWSIAWWCFPTSDRSIASRSTSTRCSIM